MRRKGKRVVAKVIVLVMEIGEGECEEVKGSVKNGWKV